MCVCVSRVQLAPLPMVPMAAIRVSVGNPVAVDVSLLSKGHMEYPIHTSVRTARQYREPKGTHSTLPPPPPPHTHTHTPLCFPSSRLVCVCVRVLGGDVWGLWGARRPCPISPLVKCPAGVGSVTSTGCTTVCASCFLASSFLVFPKRKWWETWMAHFWRIGGVPWRSIW
jgi:hypothetical protein